MIYEFRTYTLHPRCLGEFLKRFSEALPKREAYSTLSAFWYSEIGPLNQVIHVWGYESLDARAEARASAVAAGVWPPPTKDLIVDMTSEIFHPLPFSPPLEASSHGPYFEMRSYTIGLGGIPEMAKRWEEHLPNRLALSPLIGVFTSDIGPLNKWVHIWAYPSLDQRNAIRSQAGREGIWPPPGPSPVIAQENIIMLAAPFSPIQ
ncbi:MAG: NIPSNAP family protein [Pseudomonadota bacterium]